VFDVSGAGDTVIATLAACYAAGAPMPRATELANLAGGIVVGACRILRWACRIIAPERWLQHYGHHQKMTA
jgi:bifunctional ADP-heptose synthase (sugar kinase/adenylyltransferase)